MKRAVLFFSAMLLATTPAFAAGFQWTSAPDPDDKALELAVWYPSAATPSPVTFGPFTLSVAFNAPLSGDHLPLVILSHGTGGSPLNYFETAAALADAGFVVAALTHTGDNYRDHTYAFTRRNFTDRPRHVSRVIDHMLAAWPGHAALDPSRIGILGHSAGGTTALLTVGGTLDWGKVVAFCKAHSDDWGCQQAQKRGASGPEDGLIDAPEPRLKAAVIDAPALVSAFSPNGLAAVKVPVQLWIASDDAVATDAALASGLLSGTSDVHTVAGGGHFAFLTPCGAALAGIAREICQDPTGFDRVGFLGGYHNKVIAFFRQQL
jgi:predicted dienelactone hydrolase